MFGCKPFNNRSICVKEFVNGYEISIAFDDSCNEKAENLGRGDIRVYCNNEEVTEKITGYNVIIASIENLIMVNKWCKEN
jgi:hypothetical protein